MAYTDTFIQVAEDSTAATGLVPTAKKNTKTIHLIHYELLMENPYAYTHEDLVYEVYIRRQGFSQAELQERGEEIRTDLFKKEHPCLRASALTKKYGWGAHYNQDGKIALYAVDSAEYQQFVENPQGKFKLLRAMRSKRK